jgi:hypothetical protein
MELAQACGRHPPYSGADGLAYSLAMRTLTLLAVPDAGGGGQGMEAPGRESGHGEPALLGSGRPVLLHANESGPFQALSRPPTRGKVEARESRHAALDAQLRRHAVILYGS